MNTPTVNRHHLFYPKNRYHSKKLKRVRYHPELIIPTPIEVHNYLHASLTDGPGLTSAKVGRFIRASLNNNANSNGTVPHGGAFAGLQKVIKNLNEIEGDFTLTEIQEAHRVADHLSLQLGVLSMSVTLIEQIRS